MKKVILGLSGERGSFSEEAALHYVEKFNLDATLDYLIDMEGVLSALHLGDIDLGIFPVVNKRGGLVTMAFDAMGKYLFTPIDHFWMDVRQYFLVKPGVLPSDINQIVSHPQAILQCQRFLQSAYKDIKLIEWEDTAKAAKDLALGALDYKSAIIAPKRSAEMYQLEVIAEDIQDENPNLTAFIVAKRYI